MITQKNAAIQNRNRYLPLVFGLALLTALAVTSLGFAAEGLPSGTKTCDGERIAPCFEAKPGDFRYPSRPFTLFHATPSRRAALLIHGLTDSPFYMKDIAKVLYDEGYDVYAILLDGHGTQTTDLFSAHLGTWEKQVTEAVTLLRRRSDHLLLGGFSTGGALASEYAMTHARESQAVLLFSPAIEIASKSAKLSCFLAESKPWAAGESAAENNPSRYNRMPTEAVCQLYLLTLKVRLRGGESLRVPTFSVVSQNDQTIYVPGMLSFLAETPNPLNRHLVLQGPPSATPSGSAALATPPQAVVVSTPTAVGHADVPIEGSRFNGRSNPAFPRIRTELKAFLNRL